LLAEVASPPPKRMVSPPQCERMSLPGETVVVFPG
jgi:hypothetical protein